MILTAYYDESGTHAGSPFTVLAGFVAPVEEWLHFDREWAKVMRKHGITHVRAKQLFHKQKQFKGWTDKQVRYLWSDMLYVLQENKEVLASKTVILEEDYRLFYVSDGPEKKERLDSKYALCFRTLLNFHPILHRKNHSTGSINFVLEAGHKNAGDALRVFQEVKNDKRFSARDAIGFMSFGTKHDTPALQAADALAYWYYRTEMENLADWDSEFYGVSEIELELEEMGKDVIGCAITPQIMIDLRQNYLRKKKKPLNFDLHLGPSSMIEAESTAWALSQSISRFS